MTDNDTHVVIVGGGFAGLGCARVLAGEEGVRVTLLDRHNYHQFQPLLYQVATRSWRRPTSRTRCAAGSWTTTTSTSSSPT